MRGGDGRSSGKRERVAEGLVRGREQFAASYQDRSRSQRACTADGEGSGRDGRAAAKGVGGVDRRDACPDLSQAPGAGNGVGERDCVVAIDGELAVIADRAAADRTGRAAKAE